MSLSRSFWFSPARRSDSSDPYALKVAVDRMTGHAAFAVVAGLVLAYAAARFAGVLSDNIRNATFEKVGQDAARRLAGKVFRHVHDLSLRFHLERRTGSLTKIVERGNQEHRHDALLHPVQHRSDRDRAGRHLRHLLREVRRRPGRRDACHRCHLHRLHPLGDRLALRHSAADERGRQPRDRPRRRFACSTTRR